jgi:transglutaminase-like putative cysteine protease
VTTAWFNDVTLSLSVTSSLLCETLLTNPYHFILDGESLRLPLVRPNDDRGLLAYYLREEEVSPVVQQFAEVIAKQVDFQTVPFLSFLSRTLYERTERMIREQGEAWPAERTLKDARGSCRDFAVLFNACCRAVGLAARFVSGYAPAETHQGPEIYLHAWSEVYLPGAGWRGFDPSRGLAVGDQHVPVAAGRTPREAAPTSGTFRGANARSQLQTQIAMSITNNDPRERWSAAS